MEKLLLRIVLPVLALAAGTTALGMWLGGMPEVVVEARVPRELTPEERGEVWGQLEAHDELERQTIELAEGLLETTTDPVAKILLDYLLRDEQKHDTILGELEKFKTHMSKLS